MRALVCHRYGDYHELQVEDGKRPIRAILPG